MKEILKVEGMSCNHCVNSIERSVGELAGVSAVKSGSWSTMKLLWSLTMKRH